MAWEEKVHLLWCLRKSGVADEVVEVMVWKDAARQCQKKKREQNTQKELQPDKMTAKQLISRFYSQLEILAWVPRPDLSL